MTDFKSIFFAALALNVVVTYFSRFRKESSKSGLSPDERVRAKHRSLLYFQYLPVYFAGTLADWLQGPYVYALYLDAYHFEHHLIAVLFVAGFGSSMILGGFIGGLADTYGRKRFVMLYAVTYILSCLTKHFNTFPILFIGRILGGIATSLLFSSFDSWLIRAHTLEGLDSYLSESFATAAYGNSIVAIFSGLLANWVVGTSSDKENGGLIPVGESHPTMFYGGYINPFDSSLVACIFCFLLASVLWGENYGSGGGDSKATNEDDTNEDYAIETSESKDMSIGLRQTFINALRTIRQNEKILLCGLVSSFFESSMYIFVFMWTPGLKFTNTSTNAEKESLPFGLIFSTFMICCMAGTSAFSILSKKYAIHKLAPYLLGAGSLSMVTIALSPLRITTYLAMLLFECCCGMYFPLMGTMKSMIVPESQRAAIYNIYRIPMNLIVVGSLLTDFSVKHSFMICAIMLAVSTVLQQRLTSSMNEDTDARLDETSEITEERVELIQGEV